MQVISGAHLRGRQPHLGQVKTCRKVEVQGLGDSHLAVNIQRLIMIIPDYKLVVAVLISLGIIIGVIERDGPWYLRIEIIDPSARDILTCYRMIVDPGVCRRLSCHLDSAATARGR